MAADDMPKAEARIDEFLAHSLLVQQMPDLADLTLTALASGWDNAMYRLGEHLVVRLPRRALSAALIEHEQHWLPQLAPWLPLPIPVPLRSGRPGLGYPWSWSVCSWLPGTSALATVPTDHEHTAEALGSFFRALHKPAPVEAPANSFRGVPLIDRDAAVRERVAQLDGDIDGPAALACWHSLLHTPPWEGPPVWLHGDLHPANLLVDDGRLSAVIDWGDLTAGDPATDFSIAWMLLPAASRQALFVAAGRSDDDHLRTRARGWALALGLAYLANSADNPPFSRLGRRVLASAIEGD